MKVFITKNGRVVQMADKEMMKKWTPEMPLLFIGYIRDKRLPTYPSEIKKDVEAYLDEVLRDVAVPKLIASIKSPDEELRRTVARNIQHISESNPDQLKIALPHIKDALAIEKNKEIKTMFETALKNYEKAQKRKKTAQLRKKLNELRKQMDQIDMDFAAGKISDEEYLKKQKEYLLLKKKIQDEEQ